MRLWIRGLGLWLSIPPLIDIHQDSTVNVLLIGVQAHIADATSSNGSVNLRDWGSLRICHWTDLPHSIAKQGILIPCTQWNRVLCLPKSAHLHSSRALYRPNSGKCLVMIFSAPTRPIVSCNGKISQGIQLTIGGEQKSASTWACDCWPSMVMPTEWSNMPAAPSKSTSCLNEELQSDWEVTRRLQIVPPASFPWGYARSI